MDANYSTIDFYDSLKAKYKEYLKPEITAIIMIKSKETVWLETIEVEELEKGLEKQTVNRIELDFITGDDEAGDPFFNPEDTIENNVIKFIDEFSPYSIIMTTDLFHKEACEKINKKYMAFGIDK